MQMDEMKRQLLLAEGVDVDEAMERFMGNEALMMKFLLRFSQDENFAKLKQAMVQEDVQAAFEAAHTLKGVAGNLSMKTFFHQVSDIVEELRSGKLAEAEAKMPDLEAVYERTLDVLKQFA